MVKGQRRVLVPESHNVVSCCSATEQLLFCHRPLLPPPCSESPRLVVGAWPSLLPGRCLQVRALAELLGPQLPAVDECRCPSFELCFLESAMESEV